MEKELERTLWVTSISPNEIFEETYVPTVIQYQENGESHIGTKAMAKGISDVSKNFKVNLGDIIPGSSPDKRKKFVTAVGDKSAYELSKDYFDTFLGQLESKYPRSESTNYKHPAKIIIAEPLAFQINGHSKQWLNNYRGNIRRILNRYEQVEFLPEPFAVYQYYRYGLRLPALQEKEKQIALIVDFGGGTFDACVIESTKTGDISQSGKNSKPLSADSIPVGGFYINTRMATYLIKRHLTNKQKQIADTYLKRYDRVLQGDLEISDLRTECQVFIRNFQYLEDNCEKYKIDLVAQIAESGWSLNADAYQKILVSVPQDPFKECDWFEDEFYAHNLRDIFIHEVWNSHLKKIISSVIKIASEALEGRDITLTLISGGSSNIRWMLELLEKDFSDELFGAEPVPVNHSFQEIVANGLAIECARRFYSQDSEFVAVTYNPIKLFLNPDNIGIEKNKGYRSIGDKVDMSNAKPGDLIPSAQSLRHFFDQELQWKIKLKRPPKQHLEYFFTRPEAEEADHSNSYNVEETRVDTRDSHSFDQQLIVSLTVREDGTAKPKFIYKSVNQERSIPENSAVGRGFYIDMTSDSEGTVAPQNFVGFDFGTSNSSACLLTQHQIKLQRRRQSDPGWQGLSSALSTLPFPVAISIRRFLSETNTSKTVEAAREAFESALAFMAFIAASELSAYGQPVSLSSFQHRSMGPLKSLLIQALEQLGSKSLFSKEFKVLLQDKNLELLNRAIDDFNDHKHHKLAESAGDWHHHVELPIKIISSMMKDFFFGYCATSAPEGFDDTFSGKFFVAQDNEPFVSSFSYRSKKGINSSLAILKQRNGSHAISLTPFIFWAKKSVNDTSHVCYWIDKFDNDILTAKPCAELICKNTKDIDDQIDRAGKDLFKIGNTVYGRLEIDEVKEACKLPS